MDLVTPISHLFKDEKNAELIMRHSDSLEARERTCELFFSKTTHYHIDFDLNIGLTEKQIQFLVDFVKPREEIQTLTFQAARDCEKINIKDGIYYPNSEVISINDQIQNTKNSLSQIRNILGNGAYLAYTIPEYTIAGIYGTVVELPLKATYKSANNLAQAVSGANMVYSSYVFH